MPMMTRRQALILAAAAPLTATAARGATTHQVEIRGFQFVPQTLSIAVGDSITFTNRDSAPHTATFDRGLDTRRLGQGESATLTFDRAGSLVYRCAFHGGMRGTVTVG